MLLFAGNSVWCEEGELKVIDERFVYCPIAEKITVQYSSIQNIDTLPNQCKVSTYHTSILYIFFSVCHSDCKECERPDDPLQCNTCQTGLQLDGPAPSSCCNTTKSGGTQASHYRRSIIIHYYNNILFRW